MMKSVTAESDGSVVKMVLRRILGVLSSLKLAVILLGLLLVLTYLGTIEQADIGLYRAQKKYFDSWFLIHEFGIGLPGQAAWFSLPLILPGAYLVSAVLFINLSIGGVLLMRRGIRRIGILIAHFGILYLLIAGAVAYHASQRGYVLVYEGDTANAAVDYMDPQIEISELGGSEGNEPQRVHVIDSELLKGLNPEDEVLFKLANLPFDLKITQFQPNAMPVSIFERPKPDGERVLVEDNFYLLPRPLDKIAEANNPSCWAVLMGKDGQAGEAFLLFDDSVTRHPKTVAWEGANYFIELNRKRWVLPYAVRLDQFKAEFFPGSQRPKSFESFVTRLDEQGEHPVHIKMNEPMRAEGYTFYQADWGPKEGEPGRELYSKLEVVRNPADRWPEYAMWVIGFGLTVHFGWILLEFINGSRGKGAGRKEAVQS